MKSYRMLLAVFFLVGLGAASLPMTLAVKNSPQESDRARRRIELRTASILTTCERV